MRITDVAGWIGMILIHGSTFPATISAIFNETADLPPLSMVLMLWSGLVLFLIQSVATKNKLYIASNSVGFVAQSVMMILILSKGV